MHSTAQFLMHHRTESLTRTDLQPLHAEDNASFGKLRPQSARTEIAEEGAQCLRVDGDDDALCRPNCLREIVRQMDVRWQRQELIRPRHTQLFQMSRARTPPERDCMPDALRIPRMK